MRRGKLKAIAAVALLSAAAFLFSTGFSRAEDYASGRAGYLKSATYYSDDWVVNFWNSESAHMEQELAQIAADGFQQYHPGGALAGVPAAHVARVLQHLRLGQAGPGDGGRGRAKLRVMLRWATPGDYAGRTMCWRGIRRSCTTGARGLPGGGRGAALTSGRAPTRTSAAVF